MKIQIEARWPRVLQSRLRRFVVAAIVAVFALGVPSALAIHDFTDVPNAHPFHFEIGAVKDAGITAGKTCVPPGTPPTYCPVEPISREAMAAFMSRGGGRLASEQNPVDVTSPIASGGDTLVTDVDVVVGGVGGQQLVFLNATFTAFATVSGPCTFGLRLWEGGVGTGTEVAETFEQFAIAGYNQRTFTVSGAVLASSGSHQYELSMAHSCSASVSITGMNYVAATFPFGWNGTNIVEGREPPTVNRNGTTPAGS